MRHPIESFIIFVLCTVLPVWGVQAAIPELPLPSSEFKTAIVKEDISLNSGTLFSENIKTIPFDGTLMGLGSWFSQSLMTYNPELGQLPRTLELEDDEIIEKEDVSSRNFWTTKKILWISSFAVIGGLIGGILAFAGGGSGEGSGSSSGSGNFNTGSVPPPPGDPSDLGQLIDGAVVTTDSPIITPLIVTERDRDNEDDTGFGDGDGSSIPHSPEPSTLLLLGLGLLLPIFRKK